MPNEKEPINGQVAFNFLKEIINKEASSAKVVNHYLPNTRIVPLTSKFWSRHDNFVESAGEIQDITKHDKYLLMMQNVMSNGPREKYEYPVTTTHEYGWVQCSLTTHDERDKILHNFRKASNEITTMGEKLASCRVTEREKFTGTRFKFNRD